MAAAWVFCMAGWFFAYLTPDNYESKATVLFDANSDLGELLESLTVKTDVLSRVETIRTALLGRPQLEKVIRSTELIKRAGTPEEMERLIAALQANTSIVSERQRGANVYSINYRDPQPDVAFEVVTALVESFVDQALGANREESQRAQAFLRQEIGQLEAELTAAESRLADFKRENVGRMPGAQGDYFERLEGELAAREVTQNELRQASSRREALREQLAGERPTSDLNGEPSDLDLRIMENQRRLEELQLRFTDLHPDVVAVQETLAQLQVQKGRELERTEGDGGLTVASDNPVFQNIQIELSKVNADIASLEEKERSQEKRIGELRELVDVLPKIEAELSRLDRDYTVKRAQYQSLIQRLEMAELSESVDQSGNTSFEVIDPPARPEKPAPPSRPTLMGIALVLGLMVGAGIAVGANQLYPVFAEPRMIREIIGLPVLGVVQAVDSDQRNRRRRRQMLAFGGAIAGLFVIFLVLAWHHDSWSGQLQAAI